jgi:HEAT repeat protein
MTQAADVLGEIGPPAVAALPRLRELLTHSYEWVRVHCAAALWETGGEAEASTVLDTLLQAWAQNSATANHVVACLDRMGLAAEPALPRLRSQLVLPRRGGRFASIDNDEELQRVSRVIVGRLT